MNNKILIYVLLIVVILLISGCQTPYQELKGEDVFKEEVGEEQQIVCNKPYIMVGTSCCLDQNENNVCDKDETQVEEKSEMIEPVEEVSKGFTKEFSEYIPQDKTLEKAELVFIPDCKDSSKAGVLDVSVNGVTIFSAVPVCGDRYKQLVPVSKLKENNKIVFESSKGNYEIAGMRLDLNYLKEVPCSDECSSDTCDGFDYIACLKKSDGCKDKENKGAVKGKCGVECLAASDCNLDCGGCGDEICEDYVCLCTNTGCCVMSPTCYNGNAYHRNSCTGELQFTCDCEGTGCVDGYCVGGQCWGTE